MYKANDCNSILKYIDIRSEDEINKDEPKPLNNTIKQYSVLGVYKPIKWIFWDGNKFNDDNKLSLFIIKLYFMYSNVLIMSLADS